MRQDSTGCVDAENQATARASEQALCARELTGRGWAVALLTLVPRLSPLAYIHACTIIPAYDL